MEATQLIWFKTEQREGRTYVFDPLRRRYVALTPEEEVRQKTLYLLVEHLQVPAGLVAVEYSLKVNGMDKRADAVVFGAAGMPLMVVECKAATVALTDAVLDQALRYYSAMSYRAQGASVSMVSPRFLLLTNGTAFYCYHAEGQVLTPMDHLPAYSEMAAQQSQL